MLVNALYHSAVVSGLAAGYAWLGKMVIGGSPPKLDLTSRDVGMVLVDVALAMSTKDMPIKQGLIPADYRLSIHTLFFFGFHMLEVYQAVGIPQWSQIGSLRTFITTPKANGRGSQP